MPTFNEIQQEIAGMLSIPDEELTPEQREAMDAYMDELAKLEADKVDGFGQFLKIQSTLAEACKEEALQPRRGQRNRALHGSRNTTPSHSGKTASRKYPATPTQSAFGKLRL